MMVPNAVIDNNSVGWQEKDVEDCSEHIELSERLRKRLYYGQMPSLERPSLAMTELAVEMLQDVAPRELGKIDMYWASEVSRDTMLSPYPLTVGLMYAKRLKKKNSFFARQVSSSDLFLVSMMMASKFLHDEGETDSVMNEEWATSAHMDVEELNELERNFLTALDWELFVNADDFWASLNTIEKLIAYRKTGERGGGFTYTDLSVLADGTLSRSLCRMLLELCKAVAVCMVAYVAGVAVLASVTSVVYSTALVVGSWVPAHHDVVLGSQSAFSAMVPADDGNLEHLTESIDPEPTSMLMLPTVSTSPPQSFLLGLFHLKAFTDHMVASGSFPPVQESNPSCARCAGNYSACHLSSGKGCTCLHCADENSAEIRKVVRRCQCSTTKRTKSRSCHRSRSPDQHRIFPPRSPSVENPSPASEASIPHGMTSPLPDAHNASLLFSVGTLMKVV